MITPDTVLTDALTLFKTKNAEYTKGRPENIFVGFEGAQYFQAIADTTNLSVAKATWNLMSKHLANVAAYLTIGTSTKAEKVSASASANDLVVYFAALSAMIQNEE